MSEYRRPVLPAATHRDEHGDPIEYGHRWGGGSPPEEAYSRTSHLDRFAPLHLVAGALVEWLRADFDVDVVEDPGVAADLVHGSSDIVRAVRLVPRDPAAGPLTFVLTSFPGVCLHAGALHDFHFPVCGCDACDDDVLSLVEELEWTVRVVTCGGYAERLDPWPGRRVHYRLDEPGVAMRAGSGRIQDLPRERVQQAQRSLPEDGMWAAWPAKR